MSNAETVLDTLRPSLLVDGYDFVLDMERSQGSRLVDERDGTAYLDMFSFYGSNALGMNHPTLTGDAEFRGRLGLIALHKPTSSGVYTTDYAEFVETFRRGVGDPRLPHLCVIEGGALAVENALKVAFDWKSRRNEAAGRSATTSRTTSTATPWVPGSRCRPGSPSSTPTPSRPAACATCSPASATGPGCTTSRGSWCSATTRSSAGGTRSSSPRGSTTTSWTGTTG